MSRPPKRQRAKEVKSLCNKFSQESALRRLQKKIGVPVPKDDPGVIATQAAALIKDTIEKESGTQKQTAIQYTAKLKQLKPKM